MIKRTTAYIALGSNLADPIRQIKTARRSIQRIEGVKELAFSSLYRSPPMGPADQPDYINAVMALQTTLSAMALLAELQRIEAQQGRLRTGTRWGPRTLDLDLLLYGQEQMATERLTVPHPGLSQRAFVLYPLQEIAPDLIIPAQGRLEDLVKKCPPEGLERMESEPAG